MFGLRKVQRRRSRLAPITERPLLSTVAGLAAIGSVIGLGYWWNRRRH